MIQFKANRKVFIMSKKLDAIVDFAIDVIIFSVIIAFIRIVCIVVYYIFRTQIVKIKAKWDKKRGVKEIRKNKYRPIMFYKGNVIRL